MSVGEGDQDAAPASRVDVVVSPGDLLARVAGGDADLERADGGGDRANRAEDALDKDSGAVDGAVREHGSVRPEGDKPTGHDRAPAPGGAARPTS
jgi:hypothetical protein